MPFGTEGTHNQLEHLTQSHKNIIIVNHQMSQDL